jgi:WD40 repeat protein
VTVDGQLAVLVSDDRMLKMLDLENGRELRTLVGHTDDVYGVALSPEGTRVASASADKTVRIWDMKSGRELITPAAHSVRSLDETDSQEFLDSLDCR